MKEGDVVPPENEEVRLFKYKYKVIREEFAGPAEFVKKMNKLGYHGWSIIDIGRNEHRRIVEVVLVKSTPVNWG